MCAGILLFRNECTSVTVHTMKIGNIFTIYRSIESAECRLVRFYSVFFPLLFVSSECIQYVETAGRQLGFFALQHTFKHYEKKCISSLPIDVRQNAPDYSHYFSRFIGKL